MSRLRARSRILKSFPARLEEIGREKGVEPAAIEVWFADEARIGQKKQDHPPLGHGARPSAPTDQRNRLGLYLRRDLPKRGKGAALIMPRCNTEALNLHLAEIAAQIAPGAHAALLADQAGWRLSGRLVTPPNITLIPLPAKCHPSAWPASMVLFDVRPGRASTVRGDAGTDPSGGAMY